MKIHFVGYEMNLMSGVISISTVIKLPFVHLEKIMFQAKNR